MLTECRGQALIWFPAFLHEDYQGYDEKYGTLVGKEILEYWRDGVMHWRNTGILE